MIDPGFNGFLSLPSTIITTLNLLRSGSDFVTLGDGSDTCFDLYTGTVIWDGQYQEIDSAESETEPLLGVALLYNSGAAKADLNHGRRTITHRIRRG